MSPASEMAAFDRDIKRVWFTLHRAHATAVAAKRIREAKAHARRNG